VEKISRTPDMTQPITLALRFRIDFSTNKSCRCIQFSIQWRENRINLMLRFQT